MRRTLTCLTTTALLACLGCAPGPGRVTVWLADDLTEIVADTPPEYESPVYSAAQRQLTLTSALNETVAFQLVLRASAPGDAALDVRVDPLVGPDGVTLGPQQITLYRAHYAQATNLPAWFPPHTGQDATPKLVPDILVPWEAPRGGRPVSLRAARNELVWVDLHVPPTAAPGDYRGRLRVAPRDGGAALFECSVQLTVLPLAIPGRRGLPVICRVDPRPLLQAHLRWPEASAAETRLLPDVASHRPAIELVNATMSLLHEHRTNPVLWASFPKLRPTGERSVDVNWEAYDTLVAGWLDGSAFADRVPLEWWPVPASLEHPDAERSGGYQSPQYARLLAAYLEACATHFAERGWRAQAFFRPVPPAPLTEATIERVQRAARILRQSEAPLRTAAHLPARSLAGFGWPDAPAIDLRDVQIWAPPAMWYEPGAMEAQRQQQRHTWLMPDQPPYAASLALAAPATDPATLPWLAQRYQAEALWIEDAAAPPDAEDASSASAATGLLYAGAPYGLRDRPLPSIRLKRLRRGLYDYELLKLLELNGRRLLTAELTMQIVPWACTDACLQNILSTLPASWPQRPVALRRARRLMQRDLAERFAPSDMARAAQAASQAEWALMFNPAQRVRAEAIGLRLRPGAESVRAEVTTRVVNALQRELPGQWRLPNPPEGWQVHTPPPLTVAAQSRATSSFAIDLLGMAYNIDGVYPFDLAFDAQTLGDFVVPARLAVVVCAPLADAPQIDGRLDDWPLAANNAAGDFRLCWTQREPDAPDRPTLPTRAFFGRFGDQLYIAIRCEQPAATAPRWKTDNRIPVDGSVPWGQDVVEVLVDPRTQVHGTSSDLFCLQIKPSGLLTARRGCHTEPPVGTSQPWQSDAVVAVEQTATAWIVELAIPLERFGTGARRNNLWGVNVLRLDALRGEYSSWSGVRGFTYTPAALGNLIMLWP